QRRGGSGGRGRRRAGGASPGHPDRFFFQAEDGIRALYVTGVQTCALPIWIRGTMSLTDLPLLGMLRTRMHWHQARQALLAENVRSEERRVGKEWRSRL